MTKLFLRYLTAALPFFLLADVSLAQTVSEQRIVGGLAKLTGAAPLVDVEILRQEAMSGSGKSMEALPNWGKVARLPQMVVEIDFKNDSVMIEPESYRTLGLIADALHHPNLWAYKFLIVGHTSATGSQEHNLDLSQRRASAIQEILSTTFSVAPARLYAVGVGENFPIEGTKAEAANNRRVQLFNLGVFTTR